MAKRLPNPLQRRALLYPPEGKQVDRATYAEQYLEQGCLDDALEFFAREGDAGGAMRVLARARSEGDTQVLEGIEARFPNLVDTEDWKACAGAAEEMGKLTFAARARRRAIVPEQAEAAPEVAPTDSGEESSDG